MKIAIYAGSFDPITVGHQWLIDQGASLFDQLVVIIAVNPHKQGYFSVAKRKNQVEFFTQKYPNVQVEVLTEDYVVSYAKKIGASFLLRGIRDAADYEYEQKVEKINRKINPQCQTVYLSSPSELSELSSSMVKSLVGFNGWQKTVAPMVNDQVLSDLMRIKDEAFITTAWKKLAGDDKVSQKWLEIILNFHSESHRHYHNLSHIVSLLKQAEDLFSVSEFNSIEKAIINYSIFFHDLVYNPQSRDNEAQSAKLFMDFAVEKQLTQVIYEVVYESILATAHHSVSAKFEITNYFLDLDLSILGAEASKFDLYEEQIREEYKFVPDDIFHVERTKLMQKLANPYKTEYGKNRFLPRAQLNLKKYGQ